MDTLKKYYELIKEKKRIKKRLSNSKYMSADVKEGYEKLLSDFDFILKSIENKVKEEINAIDDDFIKKVTYYHYVKFKPWEEIAKKLGYYYTADNIRRAVHCYFDRKK